MNQQLEPSTPVCCFCKTPLILKWDVQPRLKCPKCKYTIEAAGKVELPSFNKPDIKTFMLTEITDIQYDYLNLRDKYGTVVHFLLPKPIEIYIQTWYEPNYHVWNEELFKYETGTSQVAVDCFDIGIICDCTELEEYSTTESQALRVFSRSFANNYYMFTSWNFPELQKFYNICKYESKNIRYLWNFYRQVREI